MCLKICLSVQAPVHCTVLFSSQSRQKAQSLCLLEKFVLISALVLVYVFWLIHHIQTAITATLKLDRTQYELNSFSSRITDELKCFSQIQAILPAKQRSSLSVVAIVNCFNQITLLPDIAGGLLVHGSEEVSALIHTV